MLAVIACVILVGGWLARPRDVPQSSEPLLSDTELEQLFRRTERRSLESTTKYFAGVAREVAPSIAHVGRTGGSGMVWSPRRIITAPIQNGAADTVAATAASDASTAHPDIWGPDVPLAALEVNALPAGLVQAKRATVLPHAGDWIVAAWSAGASAGFAAGNFRQSALTSCGRASVDEVVSSLSFSSSMVGGGISNLEGRLLAVILPCANRLVAISGASIDRILEQESTLVRGVSRQYGLEPRRCRAVKPITSKSRMASWSAASGTVLSPAWRDCGRATS